MRTSTIFLLLINVVGCSENTITVVGDSQPCDPPQTTVTSTEALEYADCLLAQEADDATISAIQTDNVFTVDEQGRSGWQLRFRSESRSMEYWIHVLKDNLVRSSFIAEDDDICAKSIDPFSSQRVREAFPSTLPDGASADDFSIGIYQSSNCAVVNPTDGRVISQALLSGSANLYYYSEYTPDGAVIQACPEPCDSPYWSDCPCP